MVAAAQGSYLSAENASTVGVGLICESANSKRFPFAFYIYFRPAPRHRVAAVSDGFRILALLHCRLYLCSADLGSSSRNGPVLARVRCSFPRPKILNCLLSKARLIPPRCAPCVARFFLPHLSSPAQPSLWKQRVTGLRQGGLTRRLSPRSRSAASA